MNIWEMPHTKIPRTWQHILAWGSLRGGLALALVATVPANRTFMMGTQSIAIQDFLTVLVITSVFFSIFVKTLSLEWLIKKL